jgi:ketosteroid isomerase-like protein
MKLFSLAMALALIAGGGAAAAQPPEQALAQIEKDFAQMQITKDPKTIDAVAATMADDFYAFDPTTGVRTTKAQLIHFIRGKDYVVTSVTFPPFFVRVFGSTAIVQGVNDSTASYKGEDDGGTFSWLDVFERRGDRWVWIFSQSSKVDDKITATIICDKTVCPTSQPGFSLKS